MRGKEWIRQREYESARIALDSALLKDPNYVPALGDRAMLAVRSAVLERGSLYGEHVRPLVMTPEESVDIDTPFDFELAAWLLTRRESER